MADERLSENFTLSEFLYSETAIAKGIDNSPTLAHKNNIKHTTVYLLEPLRKLLNAKYKKYNNKLVKKVSIKITSGYRSSKLNSAIKNSSKTSEHLKGCAADIEVKIHFYDGTKTILPYTILYDNIKQWVKGGNLTVNQCIQEESKDGGKWVHVSLAEQIKDSKKEFLIYKNGRYYKDKD